MADVDRRHLAAIHELAGGDRDCCFRLTCADYVLGD